MASQACLVQTVRCIGLLTPYWITRISTWVQNPGRLPGALAASVTSLVILVMIEDVLIAAGYCCVSCRVWAKTLHYSTSSAYSFAQAVRAPINAMTSCHKGRTGEGDRREPQEFIDL